MNIINSGVNLFCNKLEEAIRTIQQGNYNVPHELYVNTIPYFEQIKKDIFQFIPNLDFENNVKITPFELDEYSLNKLQSITACICDLIVTTNKELMKQVNKANENYYDTGKRFSFVYGIQNKMTVDDLIGYTMYYKLYQYRKESENSDLSNEITEIINKNINNKYMYLFKNFNSIEHSSIEASIKVKPSLESMYSSLYIIINTIMSKYKNIETCVLSLFTCNPKLLNLISRICENASSICRSGNGNDEDPFKISNFTESVNTTIDICKKLIELSTLKKKLDYVTNLVINTNEMTILFVFLHTISLAVLSEIYIELRSDEFEKYVEKFTKNKLIVNNCVHVNTMKSIYDDCVSSRLKHDFIKNKITREIYNIQSNDEMYMKMCDMNNDVSVIVAIIVYSAFLDEQDKLNTQSSPTNQTP